MEKSEHIQSEESTLDKTLKSVDMPNVFEEEIDASQ